MPAQHRSSKPRLACCQCRRAPRKATSAASGVGGVARCGALARQCTSKQATDRPLLSQVITLASCRSDHETHATNSVVSLFGSACTRGRIAVCRPHPPAHSMLPLSSPRSAAPLPNLSWQVIHSSHAAAFTPHRRRRRHRCRPVSARSMPRRAPRDDRRRRAHAWAMCMDVPWAWAWLSAAHLSAWRHCAVGIIGSCLHTAAAAHVCLRIAAPGDACAVMYILSCACVRFSRWDPTAASSALTWHISLPRAAHIITQRRGGVTSMCLSNSFTFTLAPGHIAPPSHSAHQTHRARVRQLRLDR